MTYLKQKPGSVEEAIAKQQSQYQDPNYKAKFDEALKDSIRGIGSMTPKEKTEFFNKLDEEWKPSNGKHADETLMKDFIDKGGKVEKIPEGKTAYIGNKIKPHLANERNLERQKQMTEETISERGGANTSSKQGSFAKSRKPKYRFGYRVAEKDPSVKEQVNETHTTQTAKANAHQRSAGGEKSPISHMVNKSIKEITKNDGKTFAQMRAEMDEACWDSHKQVGTKMKGGKQVPNCVPKNEDKDPQSADKGKKEQEAGEDTRDKKQKTMSGQVATSPEMNPKVDYKY